MIWTLKFILLAVMFSGCAIFTETIIVEKPTYIERPLPTLKTYDVNSTYKFKGLIKDGDYTKVPTKQFKEYIDIKFDLEKGLEKSNDQVEFYMRMVKGNYESNNSK